MYPSSPVLPANQLKLYIVFFRPDARRRFLADSSFNRSRRQARLFALCRAGALESRQYQAHPDFRSRPHQTRRQAKCGSRAGASGRKALYADHRPGSSRMLSGRLLAEPFRHQFAVGADERRAVDTALWKLSQPKAGTTDPLIIRFDRPLDHALLSDAFQIPGVSGVATVGPGETEWRFQPKQPWRRGAHRVIVDMALEDLAGNRIGRPFDVDTMTNPTERITKQSTSLTFRIP